MFPLLSLSLCPSVAGCPDSLIKETHHFWVLGEEQVCVSLWVPSHNNTASVSLWVPSHNNTACVSLWVPSTHMCSNHHLLWMWEMEIEGSIWVWVILDTQKLFFPKVFPQEVGSNHFHILFMVKPCLQWMENVDSDSLSASTLPSLSFSLSFYLYPSLPLSLPLPFPLSLFLSLFLPLPFPPSLSFSLSLYPYPFLPLSLPLPFRLSLSLPLPFPLSLSLPFPLSLWLYLYPFTLCLSDSTLPSLSLCLYLSLSLSIQFKLDSLAWLFPSSVTKNLYF